MTQDNEIDRLLKDILVDAYGEVEQLWAFFAVFQEELPWPAEGTVIGEKVSVVKIDFDGNQQRALAAPKTLLATRECTALSPGRLTRDPRGSDHGDRFRIMRRRVMR